MTYATVQIDLSEIDTEDLQNELKLRNERFGNPDLNQIYCAFKLNQPDMALVLTRDFVCRQLGKIL